MKIGRHGVLEQSLRNHLAATFSFLQTEEVLFQWLRYHWDSSPGILSKQYTYSSGSLRNMRKLRAILRKWHTVTCCVIVADHIYSSEFHFKRLCSMVAAAHTY